jgi:hypothetical protein
VPKRCHAAHDFARIGFAADGRITRHNRARAQRHMGKEMVRKPRGGRWTQSRMGNRPPRLGRRSHL